MAIVTISELVSISKKLLLNAGLSSAESEIVLNHLLDGELSGHTSHGFLRIPKIINDLKEHQSFDISVEKETDISALVNGGYKTGLLIGVKAVELAIAKASRQGIGIIGGYNNTGTIGSLGYYTRILAENGFIGIMMVASEYAMAPWGGIDAVLGTNPISFSFPNKEKPIVIDFATSVWSYGALKLAMKEGRKVPFGVVIDERGEDSTDPNDADNGSQLPIAQHKGYALALAIEILAGLFVNAKAGNSAVKGTDGFTLIALRPDLFVEKDQYIQSISTLIEEIKGSRLRPGFQRIYLPGEKSDERRLANSKTQEIVLPDEILNDIRSLQ